MSQGGFPVERARKVRAVILDVDGVLTDAGVYMNGSTGEEWKRFDIQDGLGLRLLQDAGILVALVSGRVSPATTVRAAELRIEECHQDPEAHKLPVVRSLLERHGLDWEEVAMVGDDLPDLPVLRRVGLPIAVANAVQEVREAALWSTVATGGRGAVRELAEALLRARGEWDAALRRYLAPREVD